MGTLEPLALSISDAAKLLAISKRSVYRLIAAGKIVARRHGKRAIVDAASLKAYYTSLPIWEEHYPLPCSPNA